MSAATSKGATAETGAPFDWRTVAPEEWQYVADLFPEFLSRRAPESGIVLAGDGADDYAAEREERRKRWRLRLLVEAAERLLAKRRPVLPTPLASGVRLVEAEDFASRLMAAEIRPVRAPHPRPPATPAPALWAETPRRATKAVHACRVRRLATIATTETPPCVLAGETRDSPRWTIYATALERYAEGRGPWPLPAPSRKYQPLYIEWTTVPTAIATALERVCDALKLPRVIGGAHYTDHRGQSVEERLAALNRAYKRWVGGKATDAELVAGATAVEALIADAPCPAPAPDLPRRVLSEKDGNRVAATIGLDHPLLARVIEEVETGRFNPTDCLEKRTKLALWRVEQRDRQRRSREILCNPPRTSLGGRTARRKST